MKSSGIAHKYCFLRALHVPFPNDFSRCLRVSVRAPEASKRVYQVIRGLRQLAGSTVQTLRRIAGHVVSYSVLWHGTLSSSEHTSAFCRGRGQCEYHRFSLDLRAELQPLQGVISAASSSTVLLLARPLLAPACGVSHSGSSRCPQVRLQPLASPVKSGAVEKRTQKNTPGEAVAPLPIVQDARLCGATSSSGSVMLSHTFCPDPVCTAEHLCVPRYPRCWKMWVACFGSLKLGHARVSGPSP